MKKLTIFIIFLLMVSTVMAFNMPHPIFGHLLAGGFPVSNAEIKVENLGSGYSGTVFTDNEGFFQIDLGNVDDKYRDGDNIKVSISYCSTIPECIKTGVISGGGNEFSWDIVEAKIPEPPKEVIVVKYICWNGIAVIDASECPIKKTVCSDGTEINEGETCPPNNSWIYAVIGTIIALFLGAGGWKIYNGKMKHFHKGITGYHDPNTIHTNPKYKHTSWKTNALKCISDVKKIQNGIDLSK